MKAIPDTLFVVGLSFVTWGMFTLAAWAGLLTIGVACCVVGWGLHARANKKPDPGEDKPK